MAQRTKVASFGGDDWRAWLALLVFLGSIGVLPRSVRPAVGAAASAAAVYKILKKLGWL